MSYLPLSVNEVVKFLSGTECWTQMAGDEEENTSLCFCSTLKLIQIKHIISLYFRYYLQSFLLLAPGLRTGKGNLCSFLMF